MKNVGFIGLGMMGSGICSNLIKQGNNLIVFDINENALKSFKDKANIAENSIEVFKKSDYIFLSLPNSDIVEKVVGEFISLGVRNKKVIDLSTSYPLSTRNLYKIFKKQGGSYIDAPLLGGPAEAAAGELTALVSGDKTDVDDIHDLIMSYCKHYDYVGESGNAHLIKIAMNFTGLMYAALLCQVFPLMEKYGINTKNLFEIMNGEIFGNWVFDFYGKKVVNKDYHLDFSLELALKDMCYMKRLYDEFNTPAFLLDGGLNLMRNAVKDGRSKQDMSSIAATMYEYLGLDTGEKK